MNLVQKVLSNGYIPIIPILVWNFLLISKLPQAYDPQFFNHNIPLIILTGEYVFRTIIFVMPLFFQLNIRSPSGKKGVYIFSMGVVLYFISWLILIYAPDSGWSRSLLGFTAPAYLPIIWLTGLSLMVHSYFFKLRYSKWHFILPAVFFSIFHILHTVYVYYRIY